LYPRKTWIGSLESGYTVGAETVTGPEKEDVAVIPNPETRPPSWRILLVPVLAVILANAAMRAGADVPAPAAPVSAPKPAAPVVKPAEPAKPDIQGPVFPVEAHQLNSVISRFGDSRDGGRRSHLGIDIAAPRGTPVLAVSDGRVERVSVEKLGGRVVWVRENGSSLRHYFAHLETIEVARGDRVKAGQEIGTVGTTGNAAGSQPHLHYAVRDGDDVLDPASLFRNGATTDSKKSDARVMRTRLAGAALKKAPGGATIAVLPANQPVTVQSESGRFYCVRYAGKTGYIARWLLKA
jgi:murein DD-endopeptidase MepM/ murein hydrolase activator NlpD